LPLCGRLRVKIQTPRVALSAKVDVDLGFGVTVVEDACAAAQVRFNGVTVPAAHVHASIMAPLVASYAKVIKTQGLLMVRGPSLAT